MHSVTKQYRDFPAAHRQPNHDGHCRLIHGHNWSFDITFQCRELDENGFVIDVGRLGFVKKWLTERFDHTLLLNEDDPSRHLITEFCTEDDGVPLSNSFARIVVVPNCGMEGLAKYLFEELNASLVIHPDGFFARGVQIVRVTVWEDSKNSATYE